MCYKKLYIIILVLLLFTGCSKGAAPMQNTKTPLAPASPSVSVSQTETEGLSPSEEPSPSRELSSDDISQLLKNLGDVNSGSLYSESEKIYLNKCYNGLSAGSPYIINLLDDMVEKKALQKYPAIITKVQKNSDETFTLTIKKVKFNPKYEPGGSNTQPYFSEIGPSETVKVGSDIFLVLYGFVQVQMDEKLNDYIQPPEGHDFIFYTCGGETLFIIEGVTP